MPTAIRDLSVRDIRFPTSRNLDGSDAVNLDPEYSCAYVVLRTDDRDGLEGHGLMFTTGRGTEQLSHTFPLVDVLPYGRQEEWQDVPDGWPQGPTYTRWLDSERIAELYGDLTADTR